MTDIDRGELWCPLKTGASRRIPDACRTYCEGIWESAVSNTPGEAEVYPDSGYDPRCTHDGPIVFSSEIVLAFQSATHEEDRVYAIVDACEVCEWEVKETYWPFRCKLGGVGVGCAASDGWEYGPNHGVLF